MRKSRWRHGIVPFRQGIVTKGLKRRLARNTRRGDTGATLIMALIYIVAISLVVVALTSWVTSDLKNTTNFSNAASFNTALRSVTELGIQNIRKTPGFSQPGIYDSPVGNCWTPTVWIDVQPNHRRLFRGGVVSRRDQNLNYSISRNESGDPVRLPSDGDVRGGMCS